MISKSPIVSYCIHDDHWHLASSIRSFALIGKVVCFVSRTAWDGSAGDWERVAAIAEREGAEVVLGDWPDEQLHRKSALAALRSRGCQFVVTPDSDEVIEPALAEALGGGEVVLKLSQTYVALSAR